MNDRKRTTIVLGGLLVASPSACKDEATAPTAEAAAAAASGAAVAPSAGTPTDAAGSTKVVEPAEPPPSGQAVAKVGALLFSSSTGDVGFELPPLGEGPQAAAGMTVNVVGEQEGRLVIETLVAEPPEHHCAATLGGLSDFRLRLYLAADDLLPVLIEDLDHELGDGTKVRVARGVPVPTGSTELLVRGTKVKVPVPADRVGRYYEPRQAFSPDRGDGKVYPLEGHALTYGGQTLDEADLYHDAGNVVRFGVTPKDDAALVTVRNPCLEVTALVSNERLHTPPSFAGISGGSAFGGGGDEEVWGGLMGTEIGEAYGAAGLGLVGVGRTGGAGGTALAYEVKAGAAILWADGRPAGQVTADHVFTAAPREEGGRSCFDAPLVEGHATTLTLCFAPGDVGEVDGPGMIGLGGLGSGSSLGTTSGSSATGSGFGSSRGFGGRGTRVPTVRHSKAEVVGSLDKDIIRRIVRAHINEVRFCYNQGLARDPSLSGKVSITFTIAASGSVAATSIADDTLADEAVGKCIEKAVKRWTFPKPTGGGVVVVTYPFVLEPG